MEKETKVVRNYKDTVFRMLFQEPENLLSLFNAVNGTHYENPEELQVNTLENAIYMSMKNDISCVLDFRMNLYEHQSAINPNMPLRDLVYVVKLYEKMIQDMDLHSQKRIMLPTPRFIVFYNGEKQQPEWKELRLSDSFMTDTGEVNLELVVLQLNINAGFNEEIKENCKTLNEYMQYVERVRCYQRKMPLAQAVKQAVDECISEGILRDFLRENKSEVVSLSIFEYDEEKHLKNVREEGREEGKHQMIANMLRDHQPPELISRYAEMPMEYVYEVQTALAAEVQAESEYRKK